MENLEGLKAILSEPKNIVILPHRKPDADALGASLALWAYLKKGNHKPVVVSPTDYPRFLNWMPGNSEVVNFEANKNKQETICQQVKDAEVVFCLDFSSLDRIEQLGEAVAASAGTKVLIDHHLGKQDFADFELWDTNAAATAELIFDFIDMLGDKEMMDLDIAQCLYAGIMTDTGSFKYSSTSSKVHRIVADLLDMGLVHEEIHRKIFDTNTERRLKFIGYALNEKLAILQEYRTAYIAITNKELKKFSSETGDTEGLVNYPLSIEGVKLAVLFIDRGDHVSMSFRSVGDFSVSEMASTYFQGGGHKNASGATMKGTNLKSVLEKFHELLPFYKEELNSD